MTDTLDVKADSHPMPDAMGDATWDLSSFFGVDPAEALQAYLAHLQSDIGRLGSAPMSDVRALAAAMTNFESIETRLLHLDAYVVCRQSADTRDKDVKVLASGLRELEVNFAAAADPFRRALARLSEQAVEDLARSLDPPDASAKVRQIRQAGARLLSPAEERLVAKLSFSAAESWGRLARDQYAKGRIRCVDEAGNSRRLPYGHKAAALASPVSKVRRSAFNGLRRFAQQREELFASALDARVNANLAVCDRRGLGVVEATARQNRISARSLECLIGHVARAAPRVRRYAHLKARALNLKRLALWDRTAAISGASAEGSYRQLTEAIELSLRPVCPPMADSVMRVRANRWLDAFPRETKGQPGLCVWSPLTGEPRVLAAFDGSLASATIFAHEHGHGFHGEQLGAVRPSLRSAPSAFAETIAILAEQLFRDGLLQQDSPKFGSALAVVSGELDAALNYLVRIPRDFAAEVEFHRAREQGELSAERLRAISRSTFEQWFGDDVEEPNGDDYSWVNNWYYYIEYFLNWPYTFAYVTASYLTSQFQRDPQSACEKLVELIAVAARIDVDAAISEVFGADVGSAEFAGFAYRRVDGMLARFEDLITRPSAIVTPGGD
jgi:oligoendopeptidase F